MLWMAAESTISVTYKIIDGVRVRVSHAGSDYAYFDCCVLASSYHSQLLHWPKACHSEAKQEAVGAPVLTFVHSIITCFLTRLGSSPLLFQSVADKAGDLALHVYHVPAFVRTLQ